MSKTARVQRAQARRRKQEGKNFATITLLLVLFIGFLLAVAYAGLGQMDHAVCRQASTGVYNADHCQQDVTGVAR